MKKFPIHKNLNTSFVNLAALVRHLRSVQFVGNITVELSSYDADIEFTGARTMRATENDHIAGRISHGEHALQRILIRAREPGGLVHVYQGTSAETESKVFVDRSIVDGANRMAVSTADTRVKNFFNGTTRIGRPQPVSETPASTDQDLEAPEHWSELLSLISELLKTVDETMSKGNINFPAAFSNACGFISIDYPFLDPDSDVFSYTGGFISVRQRLDVQELTSGILAALGRIVERLHQDTHFGKTHHLTVHRLRVLAQGRRSQFDKFSITSKLQAIIGI